MLFAELRLAEPILRSVASEGYSAATPVQAQAIPIVLKGQDLLACAQTGTGKTAAFVLPILHRLFCSAGGDGHAGAASRPHQGRCLVLCPTRELATQIAEATRVYGRHLSPRLALIFGGVGQQPQIQALRRGVDIIVATPGRLLDLMNQGHVDLSGIQTLVLDEADRMLDMGFINDIRKVVAKVPQRRQTMLFSATMPQEIRRLAQAMLRNPATVQVAPASATAENIDESVYFVAKQNKPTLLAHLVKGLSMKRAIVFTRTKHGADRVVRQLQKHGIRAEALHSNKSQNARQRALENFRASRVPVLVATDIASRGIDIDDITHVVNYDLTHEPETYVHRIGRTARAGGAGAALSFCDQDEVPNLQAIQRLIRRAIQVKTDHPVYLNNAPGIAQPSYTPPRRPERQHGHRASERRGNGAAVAVDVAKPGGGVSAARFGGGRKGKFKLRRRVWG